MLNVPQSALEFLPCKKRKSSRREIPLQGWKDWQSMLCEQNIVFDLQK